MKITRVIEKHGGSCVVKPIKKYKAEYRDGKPVHEE